MLRATVDELVEQGYTDLSLELIARRAGVNKATLYRRWRGREGLVLDAVEWYGVAHAEVPDTGAFDEDLREWARSICSMLNHPTAGALVLAVFAGDRMATRPLRQRFWQSRLERVRPLVERAIRRGEIPADIDVDEVIRHVGAPLYYRFLVLVEPVTEDAAELAAAVTARAAARRLLSGIPPAGAAHGLASHSCRSPVGWRGWSWFIVPRCSASYLRWRWRCRGGRRRTSGRGGTGTRQHRDHGAPAAADEVGPEVPVARSAIWPSPTGPRHRVG